MTHQETRQRIAEIEAEIFGRAAYLDASILKRPDPAAQLSREARREALRKEREALLATLPKTGEASGRHMVMNRTLGTVIVRESELDPPPEKFDRSDPYQKFAAEQGWDP